LLAGLHTDPLVSANLDLVTTLIDNTYDGVVGRRRDVG
jgi:hypothetical protein